eukprot:747217-Hanusia_phi.AAC.1
MRRHGQRSHIRLIGSHAVIVVYDIFGFQDECPQVKQVCDRLAAYGFLVVVPDIFVNSNNKPWPVDKFPPKPEDNLHAWIAGSDGTFFYTESLSQVCILSSSASLCSSTNSTNTTHTTSRPSLLTLLLILNFQPFFSTPRNFRTSSRSAGSTSRARASRLTAPWGWLLARSGSGPEHVCGSFCWGGFICMRFGGEATEGLRSTIAVHAAFWDKVREWASGLTWGGWRKSRDSGVMKGGRGCGVASAERRRRRRREKGMGMGMEEEKRMACDFLWG